MSHTPYSNVISNIEVNDGENEAKLELTEEGSNIYTLISGVSIYGEDFLIYVDVLNDENNFFADLMYSDSIDKDENTPIFSKILEKLEDEGSTSLKAGFDTPLVFDYIVGMVKTSFLRNNTEAREKVISIYDFVKNFGMDKREATNIANAISENEKIREILISLIERITLHDLVSVPLVRKDGVWQYNETRGEVGKRDLIDALLRTKDGGTLELF